MQLLQQKDPLQAAKDLKDSLIIRVSEAAEHLASVMQACNREFWMQPSLVLLDLLNSDVPASLALFASNTALAQACNDALVLVGSPVKAPVERLRTDIVFNGESFVVQPVVVAEPDPVTAVDDETGTNSYEPK